MNQLGTMYATKRRRRNAKSVKPQPKDGITKSNPSKRHRERLNSELDTLAALLPYEHSILSKLDKLSILRLSVSYLRTKTYFQVALHNYQMERKEHCGKSRDIILYQEHLLEGDQILQALNGFVLILNCEGEVFFSSHTVENYLGFHQSDIVHQSVYELVHSEDREELQRQLMWNSHLPSDKSNITIPEVVRPENCHLLERSFTVRFRCLLDNTSGFLRLDIRGRIKVLHGQNRKTEEPPLALFAVCSPFGPPSLLDMPQKDVMFKSKHKLDLSLVSMDSRGKTLLGYTDGDLTNKSGYDLVHYDDVAYVAQAHQELLKTGASGLIAYRLSCKDKTWQWLQTSTRMMYKNSKPDFIACTHRPLVEEEGRDLLGKRTMDFKIGFLDAALNDRNSTMSENDLQTVVRPSNQTPSSRRYKSSPQIRDILGNCRSKKSSKLNVVANNDHSYLEDNVNTTSYNSMYATYPSATENGIGTYATAFQPNFYPTIDNSRFLTTAENFLHYRHHLSSYYPDYAAHTSPYTGNSLLDVTSAAVAPRSCFSTPGYPDPVQMPKEERLFPCQLESIKCSRNSDNSTRLVQPVPGKPSTYCEGYSTIATAIDPPSVRDGFFSGSTISLQSVLPPSFDRDVKYAEQTMCTSSLQYHQNDLLKLKTVEVLCPSNEDQHKVKIECNRNLEQPSNILQNNSIDSRDTVLMWGNALDNRDEFLVNCTKAVKVDSLETNANSRIDKSTSENEESSCKWAVATSSVRCCDNSSSAAATTTTTTNDATNNNETENNNNNNNNHNITTTSPSTSSSPPSVINITSNGKLAYCSDISVSYSSTCGTGNNISEVLKYYFLEFSLTFQSRC
ncbi:AHR (predicted) [Pycnogonum litorale]